MLEGVRILIDRMESSPEDFVYDTNHLHVQRTPKFYYITEAINQILEGGTKYNMFSHLTSEEKTALIVAFRKMMRQAFTAQVIARTFEDKVEEAPQLMVTAPMGIYGKAVAKHPGAPVAYFGAEAVETKTAYAQINPWK
jgi:hypothetical protein